jgi:hypothetical protein
MNFNDLCKGILGKDKSIRFVCVATPDGEILATQYKEGLIPLLTPSESELLIMQSLIKMNMGKTLEPKLGRTIYAFTEYANEKTASFVMYDQQTFKQDAIVIISFDKSVDVCSIIQEKMKPIIEKF